MASSTLSSRGQLVIPVEIRAFLGLRPGDRIDFVLRDDGTVLLRPALVDIRELRGLLRREGGTTVSVERMNEVIRAGRDGA